MIIDWSVADFDACVDTMLDFFDGEANPWFVEAITRLYPALDARALCEAPPDARRERAAEALRPVYDGARGEMQAQCDIFRAAWAACRQDATLAFLGIFGLPVVRAVGRLSALVTLNPVCPRYLDRNEFTVFYRDPASYAVETALHEAAHFCWFAAWRGIFGDDPALYESPHLPWMLSEMAIDPLLSDDALRPHILSERTAYPCFYGIETGDGDLMEQLRQLYRQRKSLEDFMRGGLALTEANADALHRTYGQ